MTKLKIALLLICLAFAPLGAFAANLNINTASAAELEVLPGIGETRAAAIVADRDANGPFSTVDDLTRVEGIGEKTVEKLRNDVAVE